METNRSRGISDSVRFSWEAVGMEELAKLVTCLQALNDSTLVMGALRGLSLMSSSCDWLFDSSLWAPKATLMSALDLAFTITRTWMDVDVHVRQMCRLLNDLIRL